MEFLMQKSINVSMDMLEYNELVNSLNELRNTFCNLVNSKENLIWSSSDMQYIRDTIDVIFLSLAFISEEKNISNEKKSFPEANLQNVLTNKEANNAVETLEKALLKTREAIANL